VRERGSRACPGHLRCCIICTMTQTSKETEARASCCPDLEALIDPGLFKALGDPNRWRSSPASVACVGPRR